MPGSETAVTAAASTGGLKGATGSAESPPPSGFEPGRRAPSASLLSRPLTVRAAVWWTGCAVVCFHLAYSAATLSFLIVGYLVCLLQLARLGTSRSAFYLGFGAGMAVAAPQLTCFWAIFGPTAIALWAIVAFWLALFVTVVQASLRQFGVVRGGLLAVVVWTGLEYFRSELYFLKFSWLNVGYCFAHSPALPLCHWLGMYGVGFIGMGTAVGISMLTPKKAMLFALRLALILMVALFLHEYGLFQPSTTSPEKTVKVAGVQLEFPTDSEVVATLNKTLETQPGAEIFVLSEYTFNGPVPETVLAWCRQHQRYLVAGGKDLAPKNNFYDTAFVVSPSGEVIFKQVKSVPVQFLKDGLPASEQRLWDSPWGKIGICICYDLSYTRVTDRLVRLGAEALIVPTMDVTDWGRHEHELHALVAPVRAAEYGIPIFRVASSGISQLIDRYGRTLAQGSFPGQRDIIGGAMTVGTRGSLPLDRWFAPGCSLASAAVLLGLILYHWRKSPSIPAKTAA